MNDLLKAFSKKIIAFNPVYAQITESITSGLLLSQLIYWHYAMDEKEFYKTDEDWCNELCMSLHELKTAKTKLETMNIITIKRKGIPAVSYYTVNINIIIDKIQITSYAETAQLDIRKPHNLSCGNRITNNTEITSEITTDIKEKEINKEKEKIKKDKLAIGSLMNNMPIIEQPTETSSKDDVVDWLTKVAYGNKAITQTKNLRNNIQSAVYSNVNIKKLEQALLTGKGLIWEITKPFIDKAKKLEGITDENDRYIIENDLPSF